MIFHKLGTLMVHLFDTVASILKAYTVGEQDSHKACMIRSVK